MILASFTHCFGGSIRRATQSVRLALFVAFAFVSLESPTPGTVTRKPGEGVGGGGEMRRAGWWNRYG